MRKLSEESKSLAGTDRADRKSGLPTVNPGNPRTYPKPFFDLDKSETKLYKATIKHLRELGIFDINDAVEVAIYVRALTGMKAVADRLTHRDSIVEEYKSGSNITGDVTAFGKFQALVEKSQQKLGLSPLYRQKIDAYLKSNGDKDNTLLKFLNGRNKGAAAS
ncbi:MAG: hypothetical protein MK081_13990 [Flavobacteriales bacterium]|uniref:hypothetical protein n=1 Tax=Sanyastnella coralliicola TaxID=3069118 RepID=UPI0027B9AC42|nr:hypothetical protein [Longitalea sp. SCSIO 12813]MCH2199885.1 hypothetical protein [Flavobacteriales bacterium]